MKREKTETKSVLFGAMTIVADFVSTFFFLTLILLFAAVVLSIGAIRKAWD